MSSNKITPQILTKLYSKQKEYVGEVETIEVFFDEPEEIYSWGSFNAIVTKAGQYSHTEVVLTSGIKAVFKSATYTQFLDPEVGEPYWEVAIQEMIGDAKPNSEPMYSALPQHGLRDLVPALDAMVDCPDKDCDYEYHNDESVFDVIIYLNDIHKWSRDQIADWVETLDHDIYFKSGEENEQDC